ncbi:MAG: patatin-like phospholipase family protein [Chloroflexota bacterium]
MGTSEPGRPPRPSGEVETVDRPSDGGHPFKLGLALGGGGARGLAHIGVLKVLEENGILADVVSGASMGGVVAIGWAAGVSPTEMERIARQTSVVGLLGRDRTGLAVAGTHKIVDLIGSLAKVPDMESLPRPCVVVAVDAYSGEEVIISQGPVPRAVQATIAIPGLFSPVLDGERILVDGGVIDPVPVAAAYELGATAVIAVDVSPERDRALTTAAPLGFIPKPLASSTTLLRLLGRERLLDLMIKSSEIQAAEIARLKLAQTPPTVLIRPRLGDVRTDQFDRGEVCIKAGEEAARAALPVLLRLRESRTSGEVG